MAQFPYVESVETSRKDTPDGVVTSNTTRYLTPEGCKFRLREQYSKKLQREFRFVPFVATLPGDEETIELQDIAKGLYRSAQSGETHDICAREASTASPKFFVRIGD